MYSAMRWWCAIIIVHFAILSFFFFLISSAHIPKKRTDLTKFSPNLPTEVFFNPSFVLSLFKLYNESFLLQFLPVWKLNHYAALSRLLYRSLKYCFLTCFTISELADEFGHNLNEETVQAFCTLASTWSASYQGFTLNKLELDGFTLTEVSSAKQNMLYCNVQWSNIALCHFDIYFCIVLFLRKEFFVDITALYPYICVSRSWRRPCMEIPAKRWLLHYGWHAIRSVHGTSKHRS